MYGLDNVLKASSEIENATEGKVPDPSFGNNIYTSDMDVEYSEPKHVFFNSSLNESVSNDMSIEDVFKSIVDDVDYLYDHLDTIYSHNGETNIQSEPIEKDEVSTFHSDEFRQQYHDDQLVAENPKSFLDIKMTHDELIEKLSEIYSNMRNDRYKNYLLRLASNLISDRKIHSIQEYIDIVISINSKLEEIKVLGISKLSNAELVNKAIEYVKYISSKFPEIEEFSLPMLEIDKVDKLLNSISLDPTELKVIKGLIDVASNKVNKLTHYPKKEDMINALESLIKETETPLYIKYINKLASIFKRKPKKRRLSDI
jgi:hypothetical protein